MDFFEVTAKCGHVGKRHYYEGLFYIRAESRSEAAAIARQKPRVKHDHKDAILSVVKIDRCAFISGQAAHLANPYFNCHSKQEQKLFMNVIAANIHNETRKTSERHRDDDRQSRLEIMRRHYRKINKYSGNKYEMYCGDIGA